MSSVYLAGLVGVIQTATYFSTEIVNKNKL